MEQRESANHITWIAYRNAHQHQKCTPAPNATHSSSSFMLFSVAMYSYNCHHVDISINCTHQHVLVTLLDSNCQCMSKRKAHYAKQFHTLFVIYLEKSDLMLQKAKQFCLVIIYTFRKSFQFFRINAERKTGLRTHLPIFCLICLKYIRHNVNASGAFVVHIWQNTCTA